MSELVGKSEDRFSHGAAHLCSLLDCLTEFLKIEIKKIKLRSFKSTHVHEKGDGPYRVFRYDTYASSVTL